MTAPTEPEPTANEGFSTTLRRQLRRPLVALALIVIVFLLVFPRFGPREITFRHRLPQRGCASRLMVAVFDGDEKHRSITQSIADESVFTHSFSLPEGTYRLVIELECTTGESDPIERTLVLDRDGSLDFDLTSQCVCRP